MTDIHFVWINQVSLATAPHQSVTKDGRQLTSFWLSGRVSITFTRVGCLSNIHEIFDISQSNCYNSTVIGTFKQHTIVWLALKLVFHLYQKANLDFGFIIPLHAIQLICVWLRTGPDWSPCGSQIHPIDVSPLSFSQCRTKCHILIYFFVWINGNWNLNLQQDLP